MVKYQFDVDDDLWQSWKDTVPRSKSLDTRLRELIQADRDGRVRDPPDVSDGEPDEQPTPETERSHEPRAPAREDNTDESVEEIVARVSSNWGDTGDRLEQRRAAARAVLQHAVDTGDHIGRSEATDLFLEQYPVDGQDEETWWRKNVRPVLSEVGEYSNGHHGYKVGLD